MSALDGDDVDPVVAGPDLEEHWVNEPISITDTTAKHALVLDGGYSAEDAALMVEHWRGCLERVLGSLAAADPYGSGRR